MCPSRNFTLVTDEVGPILWRPWESDAEESSHIAPESHFILSRTSPSSLRCNMCDSTFKRDSELKRHKSSKHSTKREKCKHCSKEFTRKDNLTRHVKLAHSSENKPFCRHCLKPLSRKDAVQRHESTCTKNPSRVRTTSTNATTTTTTTPNDTLDSPAPEQDIVYPFQVPAILRLKMKKRASGKLF